MELASLGIEIEVWGDEGEVTEEARWVREMMQVRGVRKVEVRIYWRMLWNRVKQPDLEKAVRRSAGSAGLRENECICPKYQFPLNCSHLDEKVQRDAHQRRW